MYGDVSPGSTTMSAPISTASARRLGEKSAAIIGWAPLIFRLAITAKPTGPQPTTSGTSSGVSRALLDGVPAHRNRLSECGVSGRDTVWHLQKQTFGERHVLCEAASDIVGIADAVHGVPGDRHRHRADQGAKLKSLVRSRAMTHHLVAKFMPEHDVTFRIHGPTIARPAGAIDELPGILCRV